MELEGLFYAFPFIFKVVVHIGDIPDADFGDLKATIAVYGNNAEVQTDQYMASPFGETSVLMSELVRFCVF